MQGEIEREYCRRCDIGTDHDLIGYDHRVEVDPYVYEYSSHIAYEMLRCRRCSTVIMRETVEIESGEKDPASYYYFERKSFGEYVERHRHIPSWPVTRIPKTVYLLMKEVYS
jgi:hypothetical protein